MAARSPSHLLGIDPRMYRHFAVLTGAVSLSVAFMADAEKRQALRDEIAVQRSASEARAAERQRGESAHFTAAPPPRSADPGGGGGEGPIDPVAADGAAGASTAGAATMHRVRPGELNAAQLAAIPPDRRQAYLSALRTTMTLMAARKGHLPSAAQLDRITAASRARSGGDAPRQGE